MNWMGRRHSWTDEFQDDVAHHLNALRRAVGSLSHDAGRYARNEASELGDALMHSGAAVARSVGRQAKVAGRAIRQEPASAVAGMIAVACFASLMFGRKSRR